jgi:DNA-binding MurR/RpiR family transcriptional regulator
MALRDWIDARDGRWTDTDRRLIATLLAHPRETALLSTNEIARRAAVHPASAVRFARKLGFEGYPPLRAHLQRELFGVSEAAERMRQRIAHLGSGSVLERFVESEMRALAALAEQVSDADILTAARTVAAARQVFLFAVGHATALTQLLDFRLGRLGCRTRIMKHVPRDAAIDLLQLGKRDAVLLFALNSVHPLVPRVVEHARERGAKSTLVTDLVGLPMRPAPDVLLAATRGGEGEPRSLAVPMTICNALVLHVSRTCQRRSLRNLEALDRIRSRLDRPRSTRAAS